MKSLLFLTLSFSAFAADFEAALSFPKRTENKVFRDRVQANWLPAFNQTQGDSSASVVRITASTNTRIPAVHGA